MQARAEKTVASNNPAYDRDWLRVPAREGLEMGFFISIAFHITILILSIVTLPHLRNNLPPLPAPLIVDVVKVSDITNLPPMPSKPQPPKAEEKPPTPEIVKQELKPVPAETTAPKPDAVPNLEKPKIDPKVAEKPPDPNKAKAKPADTDFDSVLKTVEKFKPKTTPAPANDQPKTETKSSAEAQPFIPSLPISISEMDAVRRQIEACWNLPAGARNPEDLIVKVWVSLNPDGSLIQAKVVDDAGRANSDPFYRAAAEAALRALLNPKCTPLKLPPEKYNEWKTMTINFDPRNMLGL